MPAKIKLREGQCYLYKGRNTLLLDDIFHVNGAVPIYTEASPICIIDVYELEYMGIKKARMGYAYLLVSQNTVIPNGSVTYTMLIPYGAEIKRWETEKALSMLAAFTNDPIIRCTMRAARSGRNRIEQAVA